jgi:hypothetical protein
MDSSFSYANLGDSLKNVLLQLSYEERDMFSRVCKSYNTIFKKVQQDLIYAICGRTGDTVLDFKEIVCRSMRLQTFENLPISLQRSLQSYRVSFLTRGEIRIYARRDVRIFSIEAKENSCDMTRITLHAKGRVCWVWVSFVAGRCMHSFGTTSADTQIPQSIFTVKRLPETHQQLFDDLEEIAAQAATPQARKQTKNAYIENLKSAYALMHLPKTHVTFKVNEIASLAEFAYCIGKNLKLFEGNASEDLDGVIIKGHLDEGRECYLPSLFQEILERKPFNYDKAQLRQYADRMIQTLPPKASRAVFVEYLYKKWRLSKS